MRGSNQEDDHGSYGGQHADVNQIKKKRGGKFVIDDTRVYVDAVKG
jgi:hypothetical protein